MLTSVRPRCGLRRPFLIGKIVPAVQSFPPVACALSSSGDNKAPMFNKIVRDNLLAIAAAYRRATGRSLSAVSKEFFGRGNFLLNIKAGKHSLSVPQVDRVLKKFRAKWPDDAQWPMTRAIMMDRDPQEKR